MSSSPTSKKPAIAVFIPFLGGFFMGEINTYLRYWAAKYQFDLVVIRTNSFGEYNLNLSLKHVDGFIFVLNAVAPSLIDKLPPSAPKIVIGCNDYLDVPMERILSDNQSGIDQLMQHLYALGHRKIGYMGDLHILDMVQRHDFYQDQLKKLNLEYRKDWIFSAHEPSMEGGRLASTQYINKNLDITAVVASSDLMAMGFIQGLSQHNKRCPQDIAITGYDATHLAWQFRPRITSINQNMFTVCEQAMVRLHARLNGEPMLEEAMLIPQELFVGQSCGAAPSEQLSEEAFIDKRSNQLEYFQPAPSQIKTNESIVAFTKAGFESLISTSYLFGPFFNEGFRAKWTGEDELASLNIFSHFSAAGYVPLSDNTVFEAEAFPPLHPLNERTPNVVTVLPITADDVEWEVIALFDEHRESVNYDSQAMYYNYLDMISFSLERDAFALLSHQREDESALLADQLVALNTTLEGRVEQRTQELESLNNDLNAKNQELEKTSEYKTQFIANMSHELRTPLNSIVGFSRRLTRTVPEGKVADAVNAIHRNSMRLLELVNDVLDVSKIDGGFLSLDIRETNMIELVQAQVEDSRWEAEKNSLQLDFSHDPKYEQMLAHVDGKRVAQAVKNLISNGIKYTNEGSVKVELGMTHYRSVGLCHFVSVSDTGIGIGSETLEVLFERFGRKGDHQRSNIVGAGLGLNLVKEIIKLHRGDIEVKTELGKGSRFTLYIPG